MSLVVVKHTWHFVTEVVPSVNKQAAILALLFTSELLIMSFSYFRQSLHHIKFTIIYPVVGCTSVFTPKMLSLPSSTFKCLYSNEFYFGIFEAIVRTVLINFLMFGKENKLEKSTLYSMFSRQLHLEKVQTMQQESN